MKIYIYMPIATIWSHSLTFLFQLVLFCMELSTQKKLCFAIYLECCYFHSRILFSHSSHHLWDLNSFICGGISKTFNLLRQSLTFSLKVKNTSLEYPPIIWSVGLTFEPGPHILEIQSMQIRPETVKVHL